MITIISAAEANQEGDGINLLTEEHGMVQISERDRPDLWGALQDWVTTGGTVTPYAETLL